MTPAEQPTPTREARLDAILVEVIEAEEASGPQKPADWLARFPEFSEELAQFFADRNAITPPPAQPSKKLGVGPPLLPFSDPRKQIQIGELFAGRYRITGLKDGGMGRVYFADVMASKPED